MMMPVIVIDDQLTLIKNEKKNVPQSSTVNEPFIML